MYKGEVLNGFGWMLSVGLGYLCFIVPGLVLHFLCVLGAGYEPSPTATRVSFSTGCFLIVGVAVLCGWLADRPSEGGRAARLSGGTALARTEPLQPKKDNEDPYPYGNPFEIARAVEDARLATPAAKLSSAERVVWEETPEARVKIKYIDGQEVGRWVFPRKAGAQGAAIEAPVDPPAAALAPNVVVSAIKGYVSEPVMEVCSEIEARLESVPATTVCVAGMDDSGVSLILACLTPTVSLQGDNRRWLLATAEAVGGVLRGHESVLVSRIVFSASTTVVP